MQTEDTTTVGIDDILDAPMPEVSGTQAAPAAAIVPVGSPEEAHTDEALAPITSGFAGGQMSGDRTQEDFKFPSLTLLQKSSRIWDDPHRPKNISVGDLVLNDSIIVGNVDKPCTIIVLAGKKRFKQVITPEMRKAGVEPNKVGSKEEVLKAGGSLDRDAKPPFLYEPLGTMLILVEAPEGANDLDFPLEFGGKHYCLAFWTVGGQQYRHTQGRITSDQDSVLRGAPIFNLRYKVQARREVSRISGDTYYTAVATMAGRNDPDFVAWAAANVPSL